MSTTREYIYEAATGFSVITLDPCLAEAKWGDIERVGTELKAKLAEQKQPFCLLDLSKLEFMGSSVVALLVRVWKAVQERQGEMVVVKPNQFVKEVLDIAGLSKVWTICPSRSEGESVLGKLIPPVESNSTDIVISFLSWIAAGMALIVLAAPFNNFRNPAGDLSVQLGSPAFSATGFSQTTFDTQNPGYVAIVGGTGLTPNTGYAWRVRAVGACRGARRGDCVLAV